MRSHEKKKKMKKRESRTFFVEGEGSSTHFKEGFTDLHREALNQTRVLISEINVLLLSVKFIVIP